MFIHYCNPLFIITHIGLIASKIDTIRAKLKGLMEKSTYGLQLKSFVVHQGFVCVSQRESSSTGIEKH